MDIENLGISRVVDFILNPINRTGIRAHFGQDEAEQIVELARNSHTNEPDDKSAGTVFILPGFLGSKLSQRRATDPTRLDLIWIDPLRIKSGGLGKLKWERENTDIEAVGALHVGYLKMLLTLRSEGFNAQYLPFDWRKTPKMNAEILSPILRKAAKVSLVAHSQGGRVARMLTHEKYCGDRIHRVITIGTPHHGLYAPIRAMAVDSRLLNMLAIIDKTRSERELQRDIVKSQPGLLEMMPLLSKRPNEDFYNPKWWPIEAETPDHDAFAGAQAEATELPQLDERAAMIVGKGRRTTARCIKSKNGLVFKDGDGDGLVAFDLASVDGIRTWYTDAPHPFMANDQSVIGAVVDLLHTDTTDALPSKITDADDADRKEATIGGIIGDIFKSMQGS